MMLWFICIPLCDFVYLPNANFMQIRKGIKRFGYAKLFEKRDLSFFTHYLCDLFFILQSKLNCEILHDDLAFEVRWAVAGDSIVLQLVAKLGK